MIAREQVMAKQAYLRAQAQSGKGKEEEYSRLCRHFPMLVHTSGLSQAIAFYQAKKHSGYLDDLAGVLGRPNQWGDVLSADLVQYRRLTLEVMSAALWLKRFAEAELKQPKDGGGTGRDE